MAQHAFSSPPLRNSTGGTGGIKQVTAQLQGAQELQGPRRTPSTGHVPRCIAWCSQTPKLKEMAARGPHPRQPRLSLWAILHCAGKPAWPLGSLFVCCPWACQSRRLCPAQVLPQIAPLKEPRRNSRQAAGSPVPSWCGSCKLPCSVHHSAFCCDLSRANSGPTWRSTRFRTAREGAGELFHHARHRI